jgi:hypothetical protein
MDFFQPISIHFPAQNTAEIHDSNIGRTAVFAGCLCPQAKYEIVLLLIQGVYNETPQFYRSGYVQ